MTAARPWLSVVMPVRNGASTLAASLGSVLADLPAGGETLVVDDGSSDGSGTLARSLGAGKVRVLRTGRVKGLVAALNLGLSRARGRYVARMDADDISLPGRFAAQAAALDRRSDLAVLGGGVEYFGALKARAELPTGVDAVRAWSLFENPLAHPAVMMRRSALPASPYHPWAQYAEDYDLWDRLQAKGWALDNLEQRVLCYRIHPSQAGSSHWREQWEVRSSVGKRWRQRLGLAESPSLGHAWHLLAVNRGPLQGLSALDLSNACQAIVAAGSKIGMGEALRAELARRLFRALTLCGSGVAAAWRQSGLAGAHPPSLRERLQFGLAMAGFSARRQKKDHP